MSFVKVKQVTPAMKFHWLDIYTQVNIYFDFLLWVKFADCRKSLEVYSWVGIIFFFFGYLTFLLLHLEWQFHKKGISALTINLHSIYSDILQPSSPPLSIMADNSSFPTVGEVPVSPPCLMKAKVSWMSTVRGNLSHEERILRRVRGILNKLTVEKYTILRTQLIDSGITTLHILQGAVSLILNKAFAEPMFCPLYAFLCHELSCSWLLDPPDGLPSFCSDKRLGKEITFKRILVNKCQKAFELENMKVAETRQQIVTGVSSDDRYKERRRNLGDIQFICELLKQKISILPVFIVHRILGQLLDPNDAEVNVEAVCLLLSTVGKELDEWCTWVSKRKELSNESPNEYHRWHETYFGWLKDVLATHPQMETRLKFMIRNLLDLRANKWVDLRHNNVKDKTIPELISASEESASSTINTRNRRAVQFHPKNQPDPHSW
ncbi:eukaryotic translation initiation factor-like isoform X1 [Papaver somniferum]|uniref:eukaryotic translation initiation factor-like isoform X1 n=1 Tax=Papaver somniferum TaxID=3469 RepID=UPI000E703AAF|nr:eukaryotic translation initiation factor-like isoform X1 [Papaver somniferum]